MDFWPKIEEKWMEKSIEKAMHLGVDFWKAKLFRSHEKSKQIKLFQKLTSKRYVNESKVRGGSLQGRGSGKPLPRGVQIRDLNLNH